MAPKTAVERFWDRVRKTDSCWEWTGYISPTGYGRFPLNHSSVGAHRYSYELNVAPIPSGLVIDHLCRNRKCVNPEHLEAVTFRENVIRGESTSAKNARKTACKYGHSDWIPDGSGNRRCRTCATLYRKGQLKRIKESRYGI